MAAREADGADGVNDQGGGVAGGLLLIVIGVFVVARTVIHDASGQNLVDRLLSIAGGGKSSSGAGSSSTSTPVGVSTQGVGVTVKHIGPVPDIQVHAPHVTVGGIKIPNPFDAINGLANALGAK